MPGDVRLAQLAIAAPACGPAAAAYCVTYTYTLADVSALDGRFTFGPPGGDNTPRPGYECLPTLARCEETRVRRWRRGFTDLSVCAPVR